MDILGLVSLIVSTAISIGVILIGYRIAKKAGEFKKATLNVSLMNQPLTRDPSIREVIFGYSSAGVDKNDLILYSLPIKISNDGELSAKNVRLGLDFPLFLRSGGFKADLLESMRMIGPYVKSEIKRNSSIHKGHEYVAYVIPEIGPQGQFTIEEPIDIAHASGIPFKIDSVSRDGVPFKVEGFVGWSARVNIRVSATDVAPVDCHFQVRSYQAQNKEELGKKIMKDETEDLREELSKIGAPEELVSTAYAPGVRKRTIVIMTRLKNIFKPKRHSTIKVSIHMGTPEDSEVLLIEPPKDYPRHL